NNVNEPPILEAGGYPTGLPLSESTKVGTEVFVLKGHDPEGSPVKYGIQLTDHFVVNPRTGVITLAKPLNRERASRDPEEADLFLSSYTEEFPSHKSTNKAGRLPHLLRQLRLPFASREENSSRWSKDGSLTYESRHVRLPRLHKGYKYNSQSQSFRLDFATFYERPTVSLFQENDTIRFRVTLEDEVPAGQQPNIVGVDAYVIVLDENDNPPHFLGVPYEAVAEEDTPVGSTILPGIRVVDPDLLGDIIDLTCVPQPQFLDACEKFGIVNVERSQNTYVGALVLRQSLDYRERPFYQLLLRASDGLNNGTTGVEIKVADIQNSPPEFLDSLTGVVREDDPIGTLVMTVKARDGDRGMPRKMIYELVTKFITRDNKRLLRRECRTSAFPTDPFDYFLLDDDTGELRTAKPLDREALENSTGVLTLIVKARELIDGIPGNDKLTVSTAEATVTIKDVNDEPPTFNRREYNIEIPENVQDGTPLPHLDMTVKDPDVRMYRICPNFSSGAETRGGLNSVFSLRLEDITGAFTVEPVLATGSTSVNIRVTNGSLDYENPNQRKFIILVVAEEVHTNPKLSSTATVTISITDANDNAPSFGSPTYTATVSETAAPGSPIITITAKDRDSGRFGTAGIVYQLLGQGAEHFAIDKKTGTITVAPCPTPGTSPCLDYEQQTEYFLTYKFSTYSRDVFIVGGFVNEQKLKVEIFIIIEQRFNKHILLDFFAVDRATGQVSVVRALDRDIAATVSVTIVVSDTTAPTLQQGRGKLVVTIIDVNHMAPEFLKPWTRESPRYLIEMQEEQPTGAVVGAFTATDADSNIAGYAIDPPSPYFNIDNITGIVRTSQVIDYEETKQLEFTVVAYDSGVPQLSTTAKVTVTVINVNDQDPKFEKELYNASVKENSPPGTRVTVVKATDGDEGPFGDVSYSLIGEHAADFNIGHETGEITVGGATVLDREVTPEITITVMASDGAHINSRRSTTVPVVVKLIDENDNRPIFSQHSYRASVAENLSVNPPAPILQVRAADQDEGTNGEVWYTIINGNENESFSLNRETGILYPAAALLGRAGSYRIEVEARDGAGSGPHSDRCYVDVRVTPVNQHKPQFVMPELTNATVEVPENAGVPNYLILTVKAIDRDPGENGRVSYHLKIGNRNVQETEEFSIDQETGELRSKIILDREIKSKFELVLVAADHGSPTAYETLRLLTVQLVDTNDNVPQFYEEYNFHISENRPKDYFIGKVTAEDKDEGRHAKVYYYIEAGNEGYAFYMDKSDGSIYANKSFDRETRDKYVLSILASNDPDLYINPAQSGRPLTHNPEHGHVNVTITVLDENDNPPIFERNDYYAGVNSMANINDFVTKVTASDLDVGDNGTLHYYVASANLYKYGSEKPSGSIVPSPFNVTQDGKLVTSGYMAEYNQDRFIVEVIAKETAIPERYAMTRVHVWVFEPSQLIRVILSRPPEEVNSERDEIVSELSNATQSRVVVDDIRYHVDASGHIRREWCDMYLHVVEPKTQTIAPIPHVLKVIDAKYDFLKHYYAGFAIENVVPAYAGIQEEPFDPALAALIALLVVLLVGAVTVTVVCCCLRHWVITVPNDIRKKDGLIKKQIIDELNTTENPLWIEQKLKLYEEQELTMQVFSEPEGGLGGERRGSGVSVGMGDTSQDNTYATIQHPLPTNRHRPTTPDYTTLPGNHNLYESAMGFQGSTFQPSPNVMPQLTVDRDGQPQFVSGLI
ncbi:Cadherin-87A, partial [Trachymyrmex septentrionalis]